MSKVIVNTAKELDNEMIEKIMSDIKQKEGPDTEIDIILKPSLIGGIVIQKDDVVLDGSVLGQLTKIKNYLSR